MATLGVAAFWQGRRVLLTGHTGFKGAWLASWLIARGAQVYGLALPPEGERSLFDAMALGQRMDHAILDIRNREDVAARVAEADPDVVFHLAAQSLVRRSYREPVETMATNVMGTVHLLDALRHRARKAAVVVVTTDKVYENRGSDRPFAEDDRLGGHDPYSASKAAAELVAASYRASYFTGGPVRVATARAGNVIGGGDWAEDRILPDLARAFSRGMALTMRNPGAVRPWQHVLDPLYGYMMLAEGLWEGRSELETALNFGPSKADERSVEDVVATARRIWPGKVKIGADPSAPPEAACLTLATDRARTLLGWVPRWDFEEAVARTVRWYRADQEGKDPRLLTEAEIAAYEGAAA